MNFKISEPILIVGIGGVGTKFATQAKEMLNSDCLLISNDQKDLNSDLNSIKISTQSVINPTVQLIRGSTYQVSENIKNEISKYSTIVILANLAGKSTNPTQYLQIVSQRMRCSCICDSGAPGLSD